MSSLRRACLMNLSVLGVGLLTGASAARAQDGMPYVLFGEPGTRFGTAVATGGDVDRDSHPDILICSAWPASVNYEGSWSIYSGVDGSLLGIGEPTANTVRTRLNGEFIGDVNGDGRDDFALGSGTGWSFPSEPTLPGLVEVRSGRNGAVIWSYIGASAADQVGCDVSGGGDLTGDGISEVVAAGPEDLGGRVRAFDGTNGQILLDVPFDYVRRAIFAGDLNADGVVDILASSPNADLPGPSREVRAISGATGDTLWAVQKTFQEGPNFGHTMAMVGDLDGDLVPDVAASQPRPISWQDQGALIFSGRTGALIKFIPLAADDGPWDLVVGDFNGDGTSELIMYATSSEPRAIGADLSTTTSLYSVVSQPLIANLTGNELVTADFNRDGFDDLVFGASEAARVDVLSGSRLRLDMHNGGFTRHGYRRDVYVRSATPNSRIIVATSFAGNGRTFIPPLNFTIDLSNPFTVIADGRADSTGYVRFILRVPNGTPLGYFWTQAVEIAPGGVVTKSNVVQQEVLAD